MVLVLFRGLCTDFVLIHVITLITRIHVLQGGPKNATKKWMPLGGARLFPACFLQYLVFGYARHGVHARGKGRSHRASKWLSTSVTLPTCHDLHPRGGQGGDFPSFRAIFSSANLYRSIFSGFTRIETL